MLHFTVSVLLITSAFASPINISTKRSGLNADAALAVRSDDAAYSRLDNRALGTAWTGTSTLAAGQNLGIGANLPRSATSSGNLMCSLSQPPSSNTSGPMHHGVRRLPLSAVYDKAESNPMQTQGHSAFSQLYTISTGAQRALNPISNSFCAGGGWLSNGTLVSVGGNPPVNQPATDGMTSIRLFTPCTDNTCDVQEFPNSIRLTSPRWYASTSRLTDGSLIIIGGAKVGGFNDNAQNNNPTYEFFPPKGNGLQIQMQFLIDALNSNLFPIVFTLPRTGYLFIASNKLAMIYDWKNQREYRLPSIPNGVTVTYPAAGASALLPMTTANGFSASVLICGGSTAAVDGDPSALSSQSPTSQQCVRTTLSGTTSSGWTIDDSMPEGRIMGDAILTPDGKVLIVNGAGTGVSGYGNVPNQIGASNADNPVYRPILYDPTAATGSKFSTNFPSSQTERLYHSTATLVPDGRIFISGSNPNADVSTTTYMTRYNTEFLSPPYMTQNRPTYRRPPSRMNYQGVYTLTFTRPSRRSQMRAVIMDIGYSTHSVHMDQRWLELKVISIIGNVITIQGPQDATYYPPGYAWLWLLADGVPSTGQRLMIGSGASPPSSLFASQNLIKQTSTSLNSNAMQAQAQSASAADKTPLVVE